MGVITITSRKGGVGKTSIAVILAGSLAEAGADVARHATRRPRSVRVRAPASPAARCAPTRTPASPSRRSPPSGPGR